MRYSREPTKKAIRRVLARHERAIVVPVLVANDEVFQPQLIGKAIEELAADDPATAGRVAYVPDAILPDAKLAEWVVQITRHTCESLPRDKAMATARSQP